jgi:hypothetical protein
LPFLVGRVADQAQFEADIQSLQRSLENSKTNHASMQKMYNSQCGKLHPNFTGTGGIIQLTRPDEAQRLRDLLRDRDAEIKGLEQVAHAHEADEEKVGYSSNYDKRMR